MIDQAETVEREWRGSWPTSRQQIEGKMSDICLNDLCSLPVGASHVDSMVNLRPSMTDVSIALLAFLASIFAKT